MRPAQSVESWGTDDVTRPSLADNTTLAPAGLTIGILVAPAQTSATAGLAESGRCEGPRLAPRILAEAVWPRGGGYLDWACSMHLIRSAVTVPQDIVLQSGLLIHIESRIVTPRCYACLMLLTALPHHTIGDRLDCRDRSLSRLHTALSGNGRLW